MTALAASAVAPSHIVSTFENVGFTSSPDVLDDIDNNIAAATDKLRKLLGDPRAEVLEASAETDDSVYENGECDGETKFFLSIKLRHASRHLDTDTSSASPALNKALSGIAEVLVPADYEDDWNYDEEL